MEGFHDFKGGLPVAGVNHLTKAQLLENANK